MVSLQSLRQHLSTRFLRDNKGIEHLAALCMLLVPELIVFLYLNHSNYLPESDGSGYLIYGHRVYQHLRDGGLWRGFLALYTIRDWRPIIFDAFLVPFLIVTGGVTRSAYSLCILFITAYTTLYSFVLLKDRLSALSAAVGAVLAVSIPSFLYLSVNFYPEISLPGLVIGVIHHLLKSEDFANLRHVALAAFLTALAFCIRPDQTLLMLGPVLLIAIGTLRRQGSITWADVFSCGLLALLTSAIYLSGSLLAAAAGISFPTSGSGGASFFLKLASRFLTLTVVVLAVCIPIVLAMAKNTRRTGYSLLSFVLIVSALPLVWYFPFYLSLFEWIYRATFGDGAQNMAAPSGSIWTNLRSTLDSSGSYVIVSGFSLAVVGSVISQDFRKCLRIPNYERRTVLYLTASALGMFAVILVGLIFNMGPQFGAAGQPWRRLLAPFCVFMLAFAILGLHQGKRLALRQCVAVCLLVTQVTAVAMKSSGMDWSIATYRAFTAELEKPKFLVPEPNNEVISVLNHLAKTEDVRSVDIEGYTDISVGGVILLSNIIPTQYSVGHDYIVTYSGKKDIPDLARRFSHIVLAMSPPLSGVGEDMIRRIREYRSNSSANVQRHADILELLSSSALQEYGLEFVERLVVAQSEALFFRSLLYKQPPSTPSPGLSKISQSAFKMTGNMAAAKAGARAIASSSQVGFPVSHLNDSTSAPWGAAETQDDTYAGIILKAPHAVEELWITVFSPNGQQHLRDISIVAADSEGPNGPLWRIVRSRLAGESSYSRKISLPIFPDETTVHIEIDRTDPNWRAHLIWGFSCLSASSGYLRNYVKSGTGVYVRELEMR